MMNYLKSFFFNFLVVFFADHILPGIEVMNQTKLPHLGSDLPFAFVLGFLNSLIEPGFRLAKQSVSTSRIIIAAFGLNFLVYALVKILPIGIQVSSVEGYFAAAICVSLGSVLTNVLEMNHRKKTTPQGGEPHSDI